jgi:hypothetical protein
VNGFEGDSVARWVCVKSEGLPRLWAFLAILQGACLWADPIPSLFSFERAAGLCFASADGRRDSFYFQEGIRFPVHYPPAEGIVFGVPHVSLISHPIDPNRVAFYVDGRRIPESAFAHCLICAGDLPAVLVSRAEWTVTDGEHILDVEFKKEDGGTFKRALRYWVDTTTPTVTGISGLGVFPGGFVPIPSSTRIGAYTTGRERKAFLGVSLGEGFPVEFAVSSSRRGREDTVSLDWKAQAFGNRTWALSVGEVGGDSFAVVGWRDQPAWGEIHIGGGAGELPPFWVGVGLRLAPLIRRWGERGTSDVIAVLDLVRLNGEVDERGRFYFGAGIYHPYGWRAVLQQVRTEEGSRWVFLVSYSVGFARGGGQAKGE